MRMLRQVALLSAFACAVALAGCASKADMDSRYQASLQRWQGATRAELEAAWGKPRLVQATPDGQVLTWTVQMDVDDRDARGAGPQVVVTHAPGAGGAGGATATVVNTGALAPAQVPITCTTHFVLKDGRVASWTFEGLGCGAPG
jgi:hypothetical protein